MMLGIRNASGLFLYGLAVDNPRIKAIPADSTKSVGLLKMKENMLMQNKR